jgi:GNAT superfamily N-acetyltransferase
VQLQVERVRDEAGAREWHAVDDVVVPTDHPGLLADPLEEVLARLPEGTPSERVLLFVGRVGGEPVANAEVMLPMQDNPHVASLDLAVRPDRRRRGIGRELLAVLLDVVREEKRNTVTGHVGGPLTGEPPGARFARSVGASPVHTELRRELLLATVDDAAVDRLASWPPGYELVQWVDRAPADLVGDAAMLMARMTTDAPLGELDWQPEIWDAARFREKEDRAIGGGRRRLVSGAREQVSGRLVAYTDIGVNRSRPVIAYQWDTIVLPGHRGRRLGLLVKAANLRLLRRQVPGVRSVQTWNAADNGYMVAVNDALGFRPVERWEHWQKRL